MANRYEHVGHDENIVSMFIPGPTREVVRDNETGEERVVLVGNDENVGEAIAAGRWADD